MIIVFRKSLLKSAEAKKFVRNAKFNYFKEKILEHLDRLEAKEKKKEEIIQKAFAEAEELIKAGFPVGTVREWKGKKYMKTAPGKWRRKYDGNTRGAKQSFAAIKKKVNSCTTAAELLQVVKENKHRFTDANGQYLPFVKELFSHVSEAHKKIKGGGKAAAGGDGGDKGKNVAAGGSGGGDDGDGGDSNKGIEFSKLSDEKKAKLAKKIKGSIVSEIKADTVPCNGKERPENAARAWIANNPQGNAKTAIGDVAIDAGAVKADMNHGEKSDSYIKLQTLPAVKNVLEKGAYLGYEKDFDGKPIDNHYFAGKIKYGGEEKIVFCRVRKNAGRGNRFYVHEIFIEEEIKKEAANSSGGKMSSLRSKDLYQFILRDIFNAGNKKEDSKRVLGHRPGRLTGNPPNSESRYDSTIQQSDNSVNKKSEKIAYQTFDDLANDFVKTAYDPYELSAQIQKYGKNRKLYQSKINKMCRLRDTLIDKFRYYNNDEEVRAATVELGERAGYLAQQLHSPKLAKFARDTLDFAQKHSFTEMEDASRKQAEKLGLDPETYRPLKKED